MPHRPRFLREAMLRAIASGEWFPGISIPNANELATRFDVSVGAVRQALAALEGERVLASQPRTRRLHATVLFDRRFSGNAFVVSSDISGEDRARIRERLRLGLESDGRVYRIERLLLYQDRAFSFEQAAIPADLCPQLPKMRRAAESLTSLAECYGLTLGETKEHLSEGVVDKLCAIRLGISQGAPISILDRTVFEASGRALEWRRAFYSSLWGDVASL